MVKEIRRATRSQYGAEEKICVVLEGLRGEESKSRVLYRREGIAENLNCNWSKEFLEAAETSAGGRYGVRRHLRRAQAVAPRDPRFEGGRRRADTLADGGDEE